MFADPNHSTFQFDLQSGSSVADFGAGSGHYSLALARAVGEAGKVYAIDILSDMLERLKNEAKREGFHHIDVLHGDIEEVGGSRLGDESVDAVLASNVLFQLENPQGLALEAKRILKKRGKSLIIDWKDSFGGIGPHHDSVFSEERAKDLFLREGFRLVKDISAGRHHYGFIVKK